MWSRFKIQLVRTQYVISISFSYLSYTVISGVLEYTIAWICRSETEITYILIMWSDFTCSSHLLKQIQALKQNDGVNNGLMAWYAITHPSLLLLHSKAEAKWQIFLPNGTNCCCVVAWLFSKFLMAIVNNIFKVSRVQITKAGLWVTIVGYCQTDGITFTFLPKKKHDNCLFFTQK